jgi:hypothetical protein
MIAVADDREYRSPVRKLVRFFERSRNAWKRKCLKSKTRVKRLTNGTRALQKSRDHWKTLAKQCRQEVYRLRRELEGSKKLPR